MFLKRYRSHSVRAALRAAREELGPRAIVLSTTIVPVDGWRRFLGAREVEVTVAAERELPGRRDLPASAREVTARLAASGLDVELAEAIAA